MVHQIFDSINSLAVLGYGYVSRVFRNSSALRGSIGVLAIMKNESIGLHEWIDHYQWLGCDRIFLIDNGSTDNSIEIAKNHPFANSIQIFSRPRPHFQVGHYREIFTLAKIKNQVEWLIIADIDEFWYTKLGKIQEAINFVANDVDLIYSNWVMFGSSMHIQQPASVREGFTMRWPALGGHASTKWICRTACMCSSSIEIHKIQGIDSRRVITDNNIFHINHYPIQSLEYFKKTKMSRGDATTKSSDNIRTIDYFEEYDKKATLVDRTLADMVKKI